LQLTPHQAKYIAHELTLQHAGGGLERLSQALFTARVDLNPHQIEAAVFALRSPLSLVRHLAFMCSQWVIFVSVKHLRCLF
jgi:hypothetical protein